MANFITEGGTYGRREKRLTDNTVTAVVLGSECSALVSLCCAETNGGTHTLTVAIYDGTNTTYLRNAKALTAKELVIFNEGWPLNIADEVRVTSGDASGYIHCIATVVERPNR